MFDIDRNQSDVGLRKSLVVPPDSTDLKRKERSIMSMGDILPPRRQAVMDRLRRRIERYRVRHLHCLPRYNINLNGLLTQHQQDTQVLRQRFLETKAKKANKKSEPKSKAGLGVDSSSAAGGGGGAPTSVPGGSSSTGTTGTSITGGGGTAVTNSNTSVNGPQPKYKRTVEDTSSSPLSGCSRSTSGQTSGECVSGGHNASGNKNNNSNKSKLTQFSVEIEFSSPGQQIQTNVKVTTVASNSIKTSGSPAPSTGTSVVSSNSSNANSCTTTTTTVINPSDARTVSKTSSSGVGSSEKSVDETRDGKIGYQVECKQEPDLSLDSCVVSGNGASQNFTESLAGFDLNDEDLKAFMDDWSTDNIGSMDLDKWNLEKFEDSVDPFRSDHLHGLVESHQQHLHHHHQTDKMSLDRDSRNLDQLPPYPVANQGGGLPLFPVSSSSPSDPMTLNLLTNMTNSTVRPPSYTSQSSLGLDFLAKESSPAAQTLKQMAEQHQQQRQQQHLSNIGLNTSSPFSSDFNQFGGTGNSGGNTVSMDFLTSTAGSAGCFLTKSGSGPLFPFESNSMTSSSGNKGSEVLYRSTQRFHLPTHLQDNSKNQLNQQRTADPKSICPGNNGVGTGPAQNILTGHCSPDISSGSGPNGSPLSFVGTKPLSHFGDSGQPNSNSPNNGTRQYIRNQGGPSQQQQQQQQQQQRSQASTAGASSPSSNSVPTGLRQQRHHYVGLPTAQNGHHLQVSQGQHVTVSPDQQPTTMFSYGQASPQVTPAAATGDHYQLSLSQSQAVTFAGAGGAAIQNPNSDRLVSVNQTTVVQMSAGGPSLNMMSHHPQLLRPTTMQNQADQPQQQQQMMQMQMEKRKLTQQQARNSHSSLTQFTVRPPPPDYGTQMNLMGGGQQQQSPPVLMPGVQSTQLLMNNNNNSISRGGNGPQPRLTSGLNVGGGRMPMMNGRNGQQQMNLGPIGLNGGGGVPVSGSRNSLGMPGRMAPFMGDDPRPPNVDIGPDGLNIGLRGNSGGGVGVGGVGQDWRQRIAHNQHPGAKFQGTNVVQMSGVNPRFAGQVLSEQRAIQSNNVDNMQMMSMQQQQLSMLNRIGSGGVSNCPSQSGHHHQLQQQQHHQQMSMMQQQQQSNSNSQQSVNAHLMTHISSSVVTSTGAANFLSAADPSSGDFSEFFESGGFGANDLLNSLDLDIQNGNSGVNLL